MSTCPKPSPERSRRHAQRHKINYRGSKKGGPFAEAAEGRPFVDGTGRCSGIKHQAVWIQNSHQIISIGVYKPTLCINKFEFIENHRIYREADIFFAYGRRVEWSSKNARSIENIFRSALEHSKPSSIFNDSTTTTEHIKFYCLSDSF